MTPDSNVRTPEHLMHLITTRTGEVPNFALFLGSGASVTSGVRSAGEMIDEWRRLLFERSATTDSYYDWLSSQPWALSEDEYSILFEKVYDEPPQRRVYIEKAVRNSHPGWGYVYLANFLANRLFDVVFTTNFDDLLNEACYLYSDGLRPIVAAHDSAIQGIRVTSGRPKIIKLHGDFLYDNIKNTLSELETLESNTKRKLGQIAQEYGLVVIGYSGRDRSVMDTLDLLLRDEDNYRQGIYWCLHRGTQPSARLESLLRKDRVYLVEIDGFDEFTADLHDTAGLDLPRPIARPLDMARYRSKLFINVGQELKNHRVVGAHIKQILRGITNHTPQLPLPILAAGLAATGDTEEALRIWEKAYEEDPDDFAISYSYAHALADAGEAERMIEFIPRSSLDPESKTYFLLLSGCNEEVVDLADEVLATESNARFPSIYTSAYTRINRAIALKRLGRIDEMKSDILMLERNIDTLDESIKTSIEAGISALKGEKERMLSAIRESLHHSLTTFQLLTFPVFEDYRDDPDFRKLTETGIFD